MRMEKPSNNSYYNKNNNLRNNYKNRIINNALQKSTLDEFNDILKSVKCLHMSSSNILTDYDDEKISFDECRPSSAETNKSSSDYIETTSQDSIIKDNPSPKPSYDTVQCPQYHSAPELKLDDTLNKKFPCNLPSQSCGTSMKYFGLPSIRQLSGNRHQKRNNRVHDCDARTGIITNDVKNEFDTKSQKNIRVMVGIDEDLEMILDMDPTIVDMGVAVLPDEGPKICGLPPINGG
jgi:hypothetical protein